MTPTSKESTNDQCTPREYSGARAEVPTEINEEIMKEVINSVLNGTHIDQKVTVYSLLAAKILIAAEESYPQAGKCSIAGYLLERGFPHTRYYAIWERVVQDIPETNRYGADDLEALVERIQIGEESIELLKSVEARLKNKEQSPYITVHSPRLVASLKYLEKTVPKFKKGSFAADLLENEALVNLGDPMNLDVLF